MENKESILAEASEQTEVTVSLPLYVHCCNILLLPASAVPSPKGGDNPLMRHHFLCACTTAEYVCF